MYALCAAHAMNVISSHFLLPFLGESVPRN